VVEKEKGREVMNFTGIDFPESMTFEELGFMTKLAKRLWKTTNLLAKKTDNGIVPMGIEQIAEETGMTHKKVKRIVDKMVKLGVMAKVVVTVGDKTECHYYVNPVYVNPDEKISMNLYLLFREQMDPFIPDHEKRRMFGNGVKQKENEEGGNKHEGDCGC